MKCGVRRCVVGEDVGVPTCALALSLMFLVLTVSPFMNFLARLLSSCLSFFSRLTMSRTLSPPAAAAVPPRARHRRHHRCPPLIPS